MTEPYFFDGEEYDDEPEQSALEQLSFGVGAVAALFVGLCIVAVVLYLVVTTFVAPALSHFVDSWKFFGEE